jgi:hypothetical protein
MTWNRRSFATPFHAKIAGVLFLLLVATGCGRKRAPLEPNSIYGSEEEYAVYRTLIADTNFYRADTIALVDSTQAWDFLDKDAPWKGRMPRLSDETLQHYLSVNRTRVPLKNIECPGKTCVLISSEKMVFWERLFPDAEGAVTVSRVGFNRSGTQALVYWSIYWAPLAAYGSVILLEKESGFWTVRQNLAIWIS